VEGSAQHQRQAPAKAALIGLPHWLYPEPDADAGQWPDGTSAGSGFVREAQVRLSEQVALRPRVWLYASFPTHLGGGNPAGVVGVAEPIPAAAAQSLAALLSVPTTGFVLIDEAAAAGSASVRFFTPQREIDACGHVTIAIATALINLVLDLVLVPRIGVIGGSVGTDVAYALYAPAHLYICQRELRLDLRPAAVTLVRTLLAGAAMTGVLLLVGSPLGEAWRIVLGGVAGLSVFLIVLRVTGELKPGEALALLSHVPLLRRLGAERAG